MKVGSGPWVLGLAGSHNGAAALYRGRELVCAVQEERLSRIKRARLHPGEPSRAVLAVLSDQGLTVDDLDLVVSAPLTGTLDPRDDIANHPELSRRPHLTITHHRAHALSAYACSGFEDTAALVVDGLGSFGRDLAPEERTAAVSYDDSHREAVSLYRMTSHGVVPIEKQLARTGYADDAAPTPLGPFSTLGLMYQQVARFTFGSWDAAGKVMGLAPLGRAIHSISEFLDFQDDGGIDFRDDLFGIGGLVAATLPWPADRNAHADLAASVQVALEEGLMYWVRRARELTNARRLVCAGGVFLNGVANERILASGLFDEVFFLPFAEDSGTAVGAAFHGVCHLLGPTIGTRLQDDSLGPLPRDLEAALELARQHGAEVAPSDTVSLQGLVDVLASGGLVGLVEGRSELGPRALGHRSLLYDPRRDNRESLNRRKGREGFRPFAPVVLAEHAADWLELGTTTSSPFMLRVTAVRPDKRSKVPAITHIDGTTRPQIIERDHPLHPLLSAWYDRTQTPMLLLTSFNRAGEPIVESMCDAVRTALALDLDALWLDALWLDALWLDALRLDDGHRTPTLLTFRKR